MDEKALIEKYNQLNASNFYSFYFGSHSNGDVEWVNIHYTYIPGMIPYHVRCVLLKSEEGWICAFLTPRIKEIKELNHLILEHFGLSNTIIYDTTQYLK